MKETRLADLLSFTRDGEWGKGEPTDGYSPALVIRGTDFEKVRGGDITSLPLRYIRSDILERKVIMAQDILIETAGGTKDQPTGRTVLITHRVINSAPLPMICASFARFLRPDASSVSPEFLFWKLQDEYHSRRMMPYHIQHTGVARFQYTNFAETFPLSLPPLPEQRAIAATLGALADKIELSRRMNETLEAMARAIFKDWFVDFGPTRAKMEGRAPYLAPEIWALFPDRLDDEGKPEGWSHFKLDDLVMQTKGSVSPSISPDQIFEHYSLPAYDAGQSPALDLGSTIKSNKTPVPPGAVLLSKLNPEISRVWLPDPKGQNPQVTSTEFLSFQPKGLVGTGLIYCLFSSPPFKAMLEGMVTGTSKSHQRISPPDLLLQTVLVSGNKLIGAFEPTIGPFLAQQLANRVLIRTLAATRDLLLPKLMSREIRVKDAEKIVEAAQ